MFCAAVVQAVGPGDAAGGLYCTVTALYCMSSSNSTVSAVVTVLFSHVFLLLLCRESDQGRLREVCEELLTDRGLGFQSPNVGPNGRDKGREAPLSRGKQLLRSLVLPVIARARTCASLVDEFVSLLDDEV